MYSRKQKAQLTPIKLFFFFLFLLKSKCEFSYTSFLVTTWQIETNARFTFEASHHLKGSRRVECRNVVPDIRMRSSRMILYMKLTSFFFSLGVDRTNEFLATTPFQQSYHSTLDPERKLYNVQNLTMSSSPKGKYALTDCTIAVSILETILFSAKMCPFV